MNTLQKILATILAEAGYYRTQATHADTPRTQRAHEATSGTYLHAAAIVYGGEYVVSDPNFQTLWTDYKEAIKDLSFYRSKRDWEDAAKAVVLSHWGGENA